jgi:hypothetical protein
MDEMDEMYIIIASKNCRKYIIAESIAFYLEIFT